MRKFYPSLVRKFFSGNRKYVLFILLVKCSLTLFAQPTISSFSPTSGPVGTPVTITGNNFDSNPIYNTVFFGAVKATVTASTATTLTVKVPPGATFQPITVTCAFLTAYSAKPFIVTFPGAASEFTATSFEYSGRVDSVASGIETSKYAIGDINNDGRIDVVTIDNLANRMTVYINTTVGGNVSFGDGVIFSTGSRPRSVAVADVNNDGRLDIIVTNFNSNTVSVFKNTSFTNPITFEPRVDFACAFQPAGIAVADIDKDGKSDLIINTINLEGYVSVLRNTTTFGPISFASKIDIQSVGGSLQNITAADIDGDGKPEITVPNYTLGAISIFRNTSTAGNISFSSKIDIKTPGNPYAVNISDLNDDGKPDMSVNYSLVIDKVSIFRNNSSAGNISFATPINLYNGNGNTADDMTVSDLNGDSKPDVAVQSSWDSLSVFKNISASGGAIQFSPFKKIYVPHTGPIFAGDFDGDGRPDITFLAGVFRVMIWKNKTTFPQITSVTPLQAISGNTVTISGENFTGVTSVSFGGTLASSFTVVNDTTIKAVVGSGASGDVKIMAPHGEAVLSGFVFSDPPTLSAFSPVSAATGATVTITGLNLFGVTSVSFGGVSASSFTVVNSTTIRAAVGAGASGTVAVTTAGGTVALPGFIYLPRPNVLSFTPTEGTIGTTIIISGTNFLGATDVRFGGMPADSFTIVSSTTIRATVLGGSSGSIKITTQGGTDSLNGFTFISPPMPIISSFNPMSGPVGTVVKITGKNFNINPSQNFIYFGPTRAVVSSATANTLIVTVPSGATYDHISVTTNFLTASSVSPFIVTFPGGGGISSNSFEKPLSFVTGSVPLDVCIVDLDADGKSDLVTANNATSTISILKNISIGGSLSFAPKIDFHNSSRSWGVLSSELDGDGKKDIVVINHSIIQKERIAVLRNISTLDAINFAPRSEYSLPGEPFDIEDADFDADGKNDLVLVDYSSLFIMRNTSVVSNISFATQIEYKEKPGIVAVATADVDGDGKIDIAFLNGSLDSVYVMRNTSSVAGIFFAPAIGYATYNKGGNAYFGPYDLRIADLNDDGKADFVVANTQASYSVSVFLNNSTPGFISFPIRNDFITGIIAPLYLGIEDLDGDGKPDICFNHEYVPNILSIIKNTSMSGNLSFAEHVDFADNGHGALSGGICTGDLDGDGQPEIIASSSNSLPANVVYIYKNKTNGPHITSFIPSNGIAGDTITITGLNFIGITAVKFGGVPAASFTVNSPTSITAVLSTGASGDITVTNAISTSSVAGFLYGLAPIITSFNPTSGTPGTVITISGTNFNGTTNVSFGGVPAIFTVNSPTTITAKVNMGASGVVSVTGPGGTATSPGFIYIPPSPVISSFSPKSGGVGTKVSILGSYFTGTTAVSFGGVPTTSFTVNSPYSITATVGSGSSGDVSVTTPDGTATLDGFTFIASPTMTSFTPRSAASGTVITITGTNLTGATAVSFGGVAATSFTVNSSSSITATVGTGASGTVRVTTPDGTATLGGFTFVSAPTITSFTPASAKSGATVTITGTNLTGATAVSFGGTTATSFTVNSSTSITAVVGAGASGNVSVTTPGGTATLGGFTFISAPIITSFTPTSAGSGTTVTITGTNLTGATAVSFGGVAATSFTVNSPTSITAVVGTGASGNVSLTTPAGTATLAGFTFMSPPTIASFTPEKARSGITVAITGTNFNETTSVSFGGVPAASFVINSSTSISAVIGAGASGDVIVTTPYGSATAGGFAFEAGRGVEELVIYPNPADEFVLIKHPSTDLPAQLKVIDMTGKVIKNISIERGSSQTRINVKGLEKGIYQVIWSEGGSKLAQKVVII